MRREGVVCAVAVVSLLASVHGEPPGRGTRTATRCRKEPSLDSARCVCAPDGA